MRLSVKLTEFSWPTKLAQLHQQILKLFSQELWHAQLQSAGSQLGLSPSWAFSSIWKQMGELLHTPRKWQSRMHTWSTILQFSQKLFQLSSELPRAIQTWSFSDHPQFKTMRMMTSKLMSMVWMTFLESSLKYWATNLKLWLPNQNSWAKLKRL